MDDPASIPLVLVHCGWPGDRELACRALGAMGVECRFSGEATDLSALIAEGRLDLVLADASGGHNPLEDLLNTLNAFPEARDLPIVLLANALDVPLLDDVITRQIHATLLAKPVARAQFEAAVRSGLRYSAGRRENRRLMAELEESQRRYHELVHGTDAIVWEAEAATGRLTFVSRKVKEWFGGPEGRWAVLPDAWLNHIRQDDREYVHTARRCGVADGRNFELEYRAVTAQGHTVWLHEAARVARDNQGQPIGLRGLVWDVTRSKKAERKLHHAKSDLANQLGDMNHLHRMSADLSVAAGQERTLEETLRAVLSVLGAEMGLLRLLDRDRGELAIVASVEVPDVFRERFGRVPVGVTACGQAVERGEPVIVEDIETIAEDATSREAASLGGYRSTCCTPLVGWGGEPLGTVEALFRDPHRPPERQVRLVELYSHQAAAFVEAARLNGELREADRRKDEFLAMLAHELRNPIAAIDNAARLASGDHESVEWALDVIGRQSRHLARLVDDLLDASRVAKGKIELRPERIEASVILRQAAEATRGLVESRGHRLDVDLGHESLWLDADPTRLQQMAVNLLTNAARYTPNGGHIRLGAERHGERVFVRVADNGVGMSPEELPKMFELFVQGERKSDRVEGGLGIGLTLVKALAEMHGGSVSASSEGPGKGSEFVIALPAEAEPMPPADAPKGMSAASLKRARVLVVDDSVDTARGLARLLGRAGHDVRTAHDGPTALAEADSHRPEFVLMDLGLPGMDGYELASLIRQEPWGRDAVLVAISGYGRAEDRRRSRAAGIDEHFVKPVDFDALSEMIARGVEAD